MIIHSIISEYDIFRDEQTRAAPPDKKPDNIVPVVTDPKKFINRKTRVN